MTAERVRELYGRAGPANYIAPLITVFAAAQGVAVIWPAAEPLGASKWVGLMVGAQALIMGLIWAFGRRARTDAELPKWARLRIAAEAVHGLAWAAMVPLVYAPEHPITLVATMALLAGMGGGVTAGLAVHIPSMLAFLTAALLPAMGLLLATRTGPNEGYAALMLVATGLLAVANGVRTSRLYDEAIRLRLDLAAQLEVRRHLQEAAEEGRRLAEAARLMAEDAAAERVRFFGAASHDLRQPVHALGLYASLLQHDPPPGERRELIGAIGACVDSLDRLFKGILGMASAAKARHEANVVAFPLQEMFERIALLLGPEAERRGLDLRLRPTPHWVQADPGVVERILTNLAANALRYTERGGVLVAARLRAGRLDLIVADTGVGLEAAEVGRVFDPFYQVGVPHRDRAQGFGLGLATVRQLSLSHGFEIDVRSRPGRGSSFRVTLPHAAPVRRAGRIEPTPDLPARQTVVVVEDDDLVADAVTRLLTTWGVDVRVCRTPAKALEVLEAREPGARWHALLDYRLPGDVNGLELADQIRAAYGEAVPVAILTGEADPELFTAAVDRGLTILQKPLSPIRLRSLLVRQAALTPT
jgi:signal transduction histidine kinase